MSDQVQPPAPPTFICPVCHMVTWNRNDVREGYCGRCHDWTGPKRPGL